MIAFDADIAASPRARTSSISAFAYPATLFLSAALLFALEPMFSKMVLPVLGGSSSVWSVAMVVFQGLLLAGYLYAHLLTRLFAPRHAALLHVSVLALASLFLPIAISAAFRAPPQHFVSLWLIGLFVASVGVPCFALAANAPLLQAWAGEGGARNSNPYALYRASNFGSFAVLIAYPFLIEPHLGLAAQSEYWGVFYSALIAGVGICGFAAARGGHRVVALARDDEPMSWRRRAAWIVLGFIPSGLLVAVTAHIATDVASGPFLWILPLALYLLTFVLIFTDRPLISDRAMLWFQPASLAILAVLFLWTARMSWGVALVGHLFAFFVAAMVCHARLYRLRPPSSDLTAFYACMSLGGVLGGIFAALLAPVLFSSLLEYPLLAFAALLVRSDVWRAAREAWLKDGVFVAILTSGVAVLMVLSHKPVAYFSVGVMVLAALLAVQTKNPVRLVALAAVLLAATSLYDPSQSMVFRARSFYGVYKAVDIDGGRFRVLYHGTTVHGAERERGSDGRPLSGRPDPLAYYSHGGPYGEVIEAARARSGGRLGNVALVGLGIGALTCYREPGERWSLYELDPLIWKIASDRALFRSLSVCAPSAPVTIGDGRLTLRTAKPGIDLLLLDIFASDSVPTHMLTKEAFALFASKLAPHGVIAFNISNHNMELASVVAASAAANGMITAVKTGARPPASSLKLQAEIAVVARSNADLAALKLGKGWREVSPPAGLRVWTDDYSDILGAILRRTRG